MHFKGKAKIAACGVVTVFAVIALTWSVFGAPPLEARDRTLASVHANVVKEYKTVRHLSAQELNGLDRSALVIFDVREDSEYAVSHLKDAIRVDPDIAPARFMQEHANQIAGKTIVVYCSVGVRSSALAERIEPLLKSASGNKVYNLTAASSAGTMKRAL